MDELLKHLQNQWVELVKDMDSPRLRPGRFL